ncbi:MAG: ORF6N domain-containing protein [Bacteriovoracaceae bacterium]
MDIQLEQIQRMIYIIRGQRVMLDSDLAYLYGVETKNLNQAVKRNIKRFPKDFLFRLTKEEFFFLKSQFGTSKAGRGGKQKQPLVFTENGVAMLSGVLNSNRAIEVNISIMRLFTKLRSFLMMEEGMEKRMDSLEKGTNQLFRVVFERLDDLEEKLPSHDRDRKKIGIRNGN